MQTNIERHLNVFLLTLRLKKFCVIVMHVSAQWKEGQTENLPHMQKNYHIAASSFSFTGMGFFLWFF